MWLCDILGVERNSCFPVSLIQFILHGLLFKQNAFAVCGVMVSFASCIACLQAKSCRVYVVQSFVQKVDAYHEFSFCCFDG